MSERIRTIKPEWRKDQKLARAGMPARVLSVVLITMADDQGRGSWHEPVMAAEAFGCEGDPSGLLREALAKLEGWYVELYEVNGETYWHLIGWKKHQRVDKPKPSRLPPPPFRGERDSFATCPDNVATPAGERRDMSGERRDAVATSSRHVQDASGSASNSSESKDSRHRRDGVATRPENRAPGSGTLDLGSGTGEQRARARASGGPAAEPDLGGASGPRPITVTDLESAQRRLWQLLDAASWRHCRGPLAGEHTAVREAALWVWQVVQGDAVAWEALVAKMLARWEADPYVADGKVRKAAANFLNRLPELRDAVLGGAPDRSVPMGPPAEVGELLKLRQRRDELKRQRDEAWGRGQHDRVQELEREIEAVSARIRELKGRPA